LLRVVEARLVKVAYFSPLPPSTSGIADYSALLLPALERLVDVEVVRPGRTRPVADADVALYHVGNDPDAHAWIVDALRRRAGVIVHSRYVESRVREHGYDGPLWRIQHPAWPAPDLVPARVDGSPLFGCFGHLTESKRIPQLLRAFAELRAAHPAARLLLVGAEAPGFDLDGRLERLGLGDEGVIREPYVEEARLWALMAACDACVLLRSPTMGETSGSAIRT